MRRRIRRAVRWPVPLTYRTRYSTDDGSEWFCVWRMWLGRVFAVDRVKINVDV